MSAKWLVSNGLVSLYRKVLSPFLHAAVGPQYGCRFTPTCSEYFGDALEAHGMIRGGFYGIRRLCRCQPWGGAGFDPVPEAGIDAGKEQEKNVNYGS